MADKKISALTDIGTGIASGDYLHVIDDPGGTPTNKRMTLSNFTPYLPYYLGFSQAADPITAAGAVSVLTAVTTILIASFRHCSPQTSTRSICTSARPLPPCFPT